MAVKKVVHSHIISAPVCCYDNQVLAWAQRTNDCLTQRVVEHLVDEQTQCASVELTMRADLHACTRLTDVTICRQLLLLHRRDTLKLFTHM